MAFQNAPQEKYITLKLLKEMRNGDCVTIYHIKTDVISMVIPMEIIQDGPSSNIDDFHHKMYFCNASNVVINYYLNATGEQRAIRLNHLKQVILDVSDAGVQLMRSRPFLRIVSGYKVYTLHYAS